MEFTSHPAVQLHIKLMPFNHSGMKIVFGWMKLTGRVTQVITGVRYASVSTNSLHPGLVGSYSNRSNGCNLISDAELASGQIISLAVMSNAFLIIYSPHQQLTSQGRPVYSKWAKKSGPDK